MEIIDQTINTGKLNALSDYVSEQTVKEAIRCGIRTIVDIYEYITRKYCLDNERLTYREWNTIANKIYTIRHDIKEHHICQKK